jgi:hypothetical protein
MAQLMAKHGESARGIVMECPVWPPTVGLTRRRPYAHWLGRFRRFHRLCQCSPKEWVGIPWPTEERQKMSPAV